MNLTAVKDAIYIIISMLFNEKVDMNKLIKCALFLLVTQLAACNTMSGMGEDIKKSAEWTKEKMDKMTPVEITK